jgi:hypothetical protein
LDLIVDSSNPQEPVNLYFQGDDLFEPFRRRRGLPTGSSSLTFSSSGVTRSGSPSAPTL